MIKEASITIKCRHGHKKTISVNVKSGQNNNIVLSVTSGQYLTFRKCGCKVYTGTMSRMELFNCF